MRDTNHTPVEARFNLDIPMPHVHMTIPEMMSMGQAPDMYGLDEDDDLQLVYFGNTAHATYCPKSKEYYLTIDRTGWTYRGHDVVKMCNRLQEYLDGEGMLVDHLNKYTWSWANTVANNLDPDRFWAEVCFLFEKEGNVIDNLAGEGDDMFMFHVNDYQIFGLQTPEDDYRVIKWVDGDAVLVGHYPTMVDCYTAIELHDKEQKMREAALKHAATVIDMVYNSGKN